MPWEKNGTPNTLNLAGDVLSVDDLTAAQTNQYLFHELQSGNVNLRITYNNDTGTNYADRNSFDGGADATAVSIAFSNPFAGGSVDGFTVNYLVDIFGKAKLGIVSSVDQGASGAGTAPVRTENVHKYSEGTTFPQITSIEYTNPNAGDYAVDSNLSVLSDVVPIPEVIGGWVELGRTTLGSPGDDITVSGLADKRYYMVLVDKQTTGASDGNIRLGNGTADSGNNYSQRFSNNGAADTTGVSIAQIQADLGGRSTPAFTVGYLANISSNEKLWQSHAIVQNTAGAANAPERSENTGKHAQTSNPNNVIQAHNINAGSFNTGAEVVVLGWDPTDIHSGNFWEEIGSTTLGSAANDISATFTAKKYIWFQLAGIAVTSTITPELRLGSSSTLDSGANYAFRGAIDGGADGTGINLTELGVFGSDPAAGLPAFANGFIINNAANEKLMINTGITDGTAGAGTAPGRRESTSKWTNTSNQADILGFVRTGGSGQWDTGTTLKIWGSD